MNIIFVLSFENNNHKTGYTGHFLPKGEITDCNVMIDVKHFFDQPVKNDLRIYDNTQNIATGQGDYYTTGCLLNYPYFKEYYKLIAIKQTRNA